MDPQNRKGNSPRLWTTQLLDLFGTWLPPQINTHIYEWHAKDLQEVPGELISMQ